MTSTSRQPVTHTVEVGKADYTFVPDVVLAEAGDYIEYAFYPRNHSVVQADYEYPCVPYGLVNTRLGFYSSFYPVDTILDDPPTYTVLVNNTEPFFFYCSGPHACIEHGMVGVVNPNASMSLDVHRQAAKAAAFVLQPGDKWPTEGPDPSEETSEDGDEDNYYTTTSQPATVTVTPTTNSAPTATSAAAGNVAASSSQGGLSTGAIAGIAIGAAAIALIAGIALWMCGRRSRRSASSPGPQNGGWLLGSKKGGDPYQSGVATPATMPPAYPHGAPAMIQGNKAYPGLQTSVIEHYGSPSASPPPQASPNYMQQNFPPHLMDPAAFNHNPGYIGSAGLAHNPSYDQMQMHHGLQFQRPEIYSGTPAPRSPPPHMSVHAIPSMPVSNSGNGQSISGSGTGNSRGGSPDIMHEMNALRSQVGTMNQPRPER